MNLPTVESFLPEIRAVERAERPSQDGPPPANEEASFDRCLKTASEKASDADSKAESSQEAVVEKAPSEPKDEQSEVGEPGSEAAGQDHEGDLARLAATEALVAMLPQQQAVPVEAHPAAHLDTQAKSPAIPVEVVDPQQGAPENSGEVLPAEHVQQVQTAQPEFVSQVPLSRASESVAESTVAGRDEGQIEIAETTERPVSLEPARAVEEEADRIGLQTEETGTPQREPDAPLAAAAPAPENSAPDQHNAVTLNTGEQIRVEVRRTGATGSVQGPAAADGDLALEDSQVIGQVVRQARMMAAQGRTEVRVRLRPPELGAVRVELTSDQNNMVEARITAERDEVRQLIERNLPQLRQSLFAAGVEVGDFDVYAQDPGGAPFGESLESDSSGPAWDAAQPEDERLTSAAAGVGFGVNRSTSAGAVDYII